MPSCLEEKDTRRVLTIPWKYRVFSVLCLGWRDTSVLKLHIPSSIHNVSFAISCIELES